MSELKKLRKLQPIQQFMSGRNSKGVYLLQGGTIVKKMLHSHQSALFEAEVANLRHLKDCKYVPKLIAADKRFLSIYTTYSGTHPSDTPDTRNKIKALLNRLWKEWNIVYTDVEGHPAPNKGLWISNTTVNRRGEMFLIDFGALRWKNIKYIEN